MPVATRATDSRPTDALAARLTDRRGGRVVFLSHCLLDENTRYLGGAGRPGCVREIVGTCADAGLGMVQLPCPEEHAWGGVGKRRLLRLYGSTRWLPGPLRDALLPLMLAYTRRVYRHLARQSARRIVDYRRSGAEVVALVGVDGSPSCGVTTTIDIPAAVDRLARVDRRAVTTADVNGIVRSALLPGPGLFTELMQRELRRRGVHIPYLAHDLPGELDDLSSPVVGSLLRLSKGR